MPQDSEADHQLEYFAKNNKATNIITTSSGAPVDTLTASLTVGANGPMLISDVNYLNHMAHFDRERVPERVVHAKGAGAYGEFEVTRDISQYTKAKIFSEVGKKTPMFVRFSQVSGESGSADTARDPRGFAIKFYTEDGNWDLVANNTPIFFIRDPILFPSFIHTQKRNPVTHLKDANMFWDFLTLRPESVHQTMFLFSDRGTPDGYRHMHGFGGHAFKFVNAQGEAIYCKFHYLTDQGIKNLSMEEAIRLSGENPEYAIQDLFDAIARGDYPSWTFKIQLMTLEQAEKCSFDPFDITKVWPHADYPLIEVGKFTLNRNPENYFAEVEQVALSPANLVPGIEASPDKMLQGRLFSYPDTQRHRLGPNFEQIPINCPYRTKVTNYQRDGLMAIYDNNQRGVPNYFPNSFNGPQPTERAKEHVYTVTGEVKRHETRDEDNFSQATVFWRKVLNEEGKRNLVKHIAAHLRKASPILQKRAVDDYFSKVDASFGQQLQDMLDKLGQEKKV